MTITATFSNGFTDTYKGARPVKAAWAIISKADGSVLLSGHSLDLATASKTAEGNFKQVEYKVAGPSKGIRENPARSRMNPVYYARYAKEKGYKSWKEAYAAYVEWSREARKLVEIEVISI